MCNHAKLLKQLKYALFNVGNFAIIFCQYAVYAFVVYSVSV